MRVVTDGLAATAVTLAERDEREVTALGYLRELSDQVGQRTPGVFRAAAAAITAMALPPLESADETERARPIRQMLGVQSVEDQLTAALRGREWLLRLADELEGPG
ncbi:MAG: hypothetical protein ABIS47_13770 [Acidimicrobiales bacterium]